MSGNSVNKGDYICIPLDLHRSIVESEFKKRSYTQEEATEIVNLCEKAALAGIRTHNGLKAIHLDEHHGSKVGICKPNSQIEKLPTKFKAVEKWNANRKHGTKTV
jgi:ureidoglycolate dehydrogenase (NAD+)